MVVPNSLSKLSRGSLCKHLDLIGVAASCSQRPLSRGDLVIAIKYWLGVERFTSGIFQSSRQREWSMVTDELTFALGGNVSLPLIGFLPAVRRDARGPGPIRTSLPFHSFRQISHH